ncbi:hypothetical protein N7456_013625 [Penicillium angulare]|uniref:Uncharacterized protein n=1 Tax=Penicillium angulare TaxID=116970 RepID=A0A9W9EFR7_9EURO|nr:hypothetical protein N7456_013625 [Penicillium angulare]
MSDVCPSPFYQLIHSELDVDSDSDRTVSPVLSSEKSDPAQDPEPAHATDTRTVGSRRSSRSSPEPFPEYKEFTPMDTSVEEAWKEAFEAALQEDIKITIVKPALNFPEGEFGEREYVMDLIVNTLSQPTLAENTRKRFIALTNMVIRLEDAIFQGAVSDFLNPWAIDRSQVIANCILIFVSWVDDLLSQLVGTAKNVWDMLEILMEEDISEVVRQRRMVRLVTSQLQKVRLIEQYLLQVFLLFYVKWVHDTFLRLRNAQLLQEESLNDRMIYQRVHLTQTLQQIADALKRSIQNYEIYRGSLHSIRDKYFTTPAESIQFPPVGQPCFKCPERLRAAWLQCAEGRGIPSDNECEFDCE